MELAFATKSLRQLCESEDRAKRDLGVAMATKLRRRVADLYAATTLGDLVAGRPRRLTGTRGRDIALDLDAGSRMIFRPNHRNIAKLESGEVDWSSVTRIKIIRLENDHV